MIDKRLAEKYLQKKKNENKCEICGKRKAEYICPKCGRKVCRECYVKEKNMCVICASTTCEICGRAPAVGRCQNCGRLVCKNCSILVMNVRRVCLTCVSKYGREGIEKILKQKTVEHNRLLSRILS